jgi:hypothetical protein
MKPDNAPIICYDRSPEGDILVESTARLEAEPIQDSRMT